MNGDGKPDLVVATDGGSLDVLINAGDGTFPTIQTYPCGGCGQIVVEDVHGDGKPDVVGIDATVAELGVTPGRAGISVMLHL